MSLYCLWVSSEQIIDPGSEMSGCRMWAGRCDENEFEWSVNHPEWTPDTCFNHRNHPYADTDLGLRGLSVCPPLKRIAQPEGRDAPASPSLLKDSLAVETSNTSKWRCCFLVILEECRRRDRPDRLTWASLTSSCLYLLTISLVRFSRKPETVSNSWSTVRRSSSQSKWALNNTGYLKNP